MWPPEAEGKGGAGEEKLLSKGCQVIEEAEVLEIYCMVTMVNNYHCTF